MNIFQTKELNGYEKIAQGRLCRHAPRLPPRGRPARRRKDRSRVGHISPAEAKSAEVTDVSGCYLFPGFIDAHTHFDLDVCNTTTADDFASGTRSAIRGGTTTIIDFACPNKGETLAYGL